MSSVAIVIARARWTLVAAAAAGGVGELVRRRRSSRDADVPPPMTTQSSPGQIADLQEAYGAEMGPPQDGATRAR
jgi:hypothetical protein